ncbi:MAG: hypothetical protein KGI49_00840 [Patescibacteria group bacterium]|nr:hypothetical protein [Patescibacteria group bacterium]
MADNKAGFWPGLKSRYRPQFSEKKYVWSLILAFALLVASLVINYFAAMYAVERASNPVADIILSNIPTFDVDWAFVYGPIIFWVIISLYLVYDPKRIPFTIKSIALFIVIRSAFITLTHIGPFPDHISLDVAGMDLFGRLTRGDLFFVFSAGADLFFSGHTGFPFLLALIFWNDKTMRWFCLVSSVFFGIVVLLGHLHYSIDVASAFFITYTIYHIAIKAFPTDKNRLLTA